ncbi:hypothetical protein CQA53_09515 [Helicobacter didelphidarum]|uniref:Uncharacterized protein n=1 Tax=Helicobacter didelphidarum TaxID=2040648 RepID=A0A3D8IC42_9HELI|nr:hypothetical protein [Helicobacter didelphidarum]RDU62111.1 hypothetical protein CQA53_09515 [Helicobacter didelphidarum]
MQVTLQISNADEKLIKALKSVISIHPQAKLKIEQEKLTENGYTPEFEAEILKEMKEHKKAIKKGIIKTYHSFEDYKKAMNAI